MQLVFVSLRRLWCSIGDLLSNELYFVNLLPTLKFVKHIAKGIERIVVWMEQRKAVIVLVIVKDWHRKEFQYHSGLRRSYIVI